MQGSTYDFRPLHIQIKLDTNVPGKGPVVFSRSMLYIPDENTKLEVHFEDYPFFTDEIKYPQSYLFSAAYPDRIRFFFNKPEFNKILRKYNPSYISRIEADRQAINDSEYYKLDETTLNAQKINREKNEAQSQSAASPPAAPQIPPPDIHTLIDDESYIESSITNDIVQHNIFTMLMALFPISYPVNKNIKSSYDVKILNKINANFQIHLKDLIPFRLFGSNEYNPNNPEFTYLKIDNTINTVTEIIWLNDLYNNSDYAKIYKSYNDLYEWRKGQSKSMESEIKDKKNGFYLKYKEEIKDDDLKSIQDEIDQLNAEVSKLKPKSTFDYDKINKINDSLRMLEKIKSDTTALIIEISNMDLKKINNYLENIKTNFEKIRSNVMTSEIKTFYDTKIKKIKRELDPIYSLNYVYTNYFETESNTIHFDFINDENISNDVKDRFKKYTDFINTIREFDRKSKSSSNLLLQSLVQKFLNNIDNNQFVKLLEPRYLQNRHPFPYFKEYFNVGVTKSNNEYSIEVRMDLIKGEINSGNRSTIHCSYIGEKLTESAMNLFEEKPAFWQLPIKRIYYDSNTRDSTLLTFRDAVKEEKKGVDMEKDKEKKGGTKKYNKNIRFLKSNWLKTRKHFYF